MVIIGKRAGQLGNRLFVFAHFVANAIEFDYELSNPSFYGYAHYFPNLRDDFFCRYPQNRTILKPYKFLLEFYCKLLTKSILLCNKSSFFGLNIPIMDSSKISTLGKSLDLSNNDFQELIKLHKILLVTDGWFFKDLNNVAKHSEEIRRFFTPAEKYKRNVSSLIFRARKECDVLVGVHIRQGDYKRWLNGQYYFSTDSYVTLMKRFSKSLGDKRIRFLICSNVTQDESVFAGLDYIMGNNHQLEDLYAFAQCDYLMGAPSTYTMWASFYGSVPLFTVNSIDEPISLDNFHIADLNQTL
ncbi:MAG: hypothetical protein HIU83_11170 [Proteobacteria bacterium]|nr:hypothetical protein [Pseudomonadota bacterium]